MSTLSQFTGGSDRNRLKLLNGSYLDDILGYANANIRDFTAQNDHLMISTTDGRVYIGKRFDQLLQCQANDSSILHTPSYDHHIGGDPFPSNLSRYATGVATYTGATTDRARVSHTTTPHKSLYLPLTGNFTVSGSSNTATSNRNSHIKRFIYSGDDLFYISWNSATDQLYIYDFTTGAPVAATYTYSGSQNLTGTSFAPRTSVSACSYPELDPATGDIVMFMRISSQGYKLTYDHSANTWEFFDTTYDFAAATASEPMHLAMSGSNMLLASELARSSYFYSTDGGNNWTVNNVQVSDNWYFKGAGVANGSFYVINCEGANGSTFDGGLMRSVNLTTWVWVDHEEVPTVNMIRNNGQGTACYISTGYPSSGIVRSSHLMAKIT